MHFTGANIGYRKYVKTEVAQIGSDLNCFYNECCQKFKNQSPPLNFQRYS